MESYINTADSEWFKQRTISIMLCAMSAFLILYVRLFYLQVVEGRELKRLSENNCIRLQLVDPPRGLIFDRNGKLMVDNRPSFDVSIMAKDASPLEETVQKLSKYIDMPAEKIMSKITQSKGLLSYNPVPLKKDIGRNALAAVEAHKLSLPGVVVDVKPIRNYINKSSAAHLLGYLSEINKKELSSKAYAGYRARDFIGKFGVEKAYEKYLKGKHGGRQVEVNATGQVVDVLKTVATEPGNNIFLTIDQDLQKKAERLIKGLTGAVVAQVPSTGEILVLVSSPSFDQNDFVSGMSASQWDALVSNPFRPLENKVIQAEYPPASVYKIVTAIAGLEEGIIDEDTVVNCPGHYRYGNRVFRCWKHGGHGKVNIVKALSESCDVFFYHIGQQIDVDKLAEYAKRCGLGAATGLNLGYEAEGLVPTSSWKKKRIGTDWQQGETLSVSIGQSYNLTTPLQMLKLVSAVANDGVIKRPLIIKSIRTADGRIVRVNKSEEMGKLPASAQTIDIIQRGMWDVVNKKTGTAWHVHVDGIEISGKTGTAQVIGREQREKIVKGDQSGRLRSHAWFVAYAPSAAPEIAVAVIIEHGGQGSTVAAPIAKEIIKSYLFTKDKIKTIE